MMFRAVARVFLPLALAVTLCIHGTAQTPDAPQTKGAAPAKGTSVFSSSLNANSSNDLASIYGTPVVQIVARVNDRVITNSDVTRAQTQLDQDARQNNWTLDQYNHNEKNLLRDLIDQQLLLSKGKQLGITGDTELIKRLDEIRKQNHLESLEDLEKAVEQQGISYEDFKANIRHSIITQQVVRDEVGSKMQISQAEIEKYYNEHKDSYTQPESVHLNEILIPTSDNATSSELAAADAKAKDIEAKLKAGASFTDMAKKYSGGPTAPQGGDLGQFRRGALAKVLEDQTFNLPVGGYTAPIRTKQGYIILQTTDHTPGGVASLQKVEPEIEQALYLQKIQPAVRTYLTRLRDEAYIDIRTGYVDSAASANESKPTYAAYAPPQPKKKKKKNRFDRRDVRFARLKPGKAAQPVMASAVAPTAVGAAGESVKSSSSPAVTTSAATATHSRFKRSHAKKQMARKSKREKVRFGRAPNTRVSDEQVATTASSNAQQTPSTDAAATQTNAVADAAAGSDVQPLGPDLEHNPTITQPVQQKRRFSDEARNKAQMEARKNAKKNHKKIKKAKKVKKDNAKATPLTPAEQAAQKVQSAPLGLEGATATKKKKKKVRVKNGEKTRLSDQKKSSQKNGSSKKGSSLDTSSSQKPTSNGNGDTTTPTPPAASAPTNQPQ